MTKMFYSNPDGARFEIAAPPIAPQPLDTFGVFAALNVVLGVWPLEDAANAAGVTPAELVAEAQGWAAARGRFR